MHAFALGNNMANKWFSIYLNKLTFICIPLIKLAGYFCYFLILLEVAISYFSKINKKPAIYCRRIMRIYNTVCQLEWVSCSSAQLKTNDLTCQKQNSLGLLTMPYYSFFLNDSEICYFVFSHGSAKVDYLRIGSMMTSHLSFLHSWQDFEIRFVQLEYFCLSSKESSYLPFTFIGNGSLYKRKGNT